MLVSIDGNIGSGKSSCLAAVHAALPGLPCFPEPVDEWEDLLKLYYASPAEWAFPLALKVLLGFRAPIREGRGVVERSPLASRHVFSQMLYNKGVMNHHEWELFKEYHAVLGWKPDVIFFVDTPAEVCLERVGSRGRPGEEPIDLEYLKQLEFQYQKMLEYGGVPVVRLDGTLPPDELHALAVSKAREAFAGAPTATAS